MLDALLRPVIDPPLHRLAGVLTRMRISPDGMTGIGFLFSLGAFAALASQAYGWALAGIALSRLCDGLDGALARVQDRKTDFGAWLDITSDFVLYAGVPFFFALGVQDLETAMAAAFLIFSYIGSGASFLAYAILAAQRGMETSRQGSKSFFYHTSLAEGTETILVMILFCLWPGLFVVLAYGFGILCWITALMRLLAARSDFS